MKQYLNEITNKDFIFSIVLFSFLIPINPKLYGYGVLLIGVELIVKKIKNTTTAHLFKIHWKNNFLWIILFFIAHLIGLIHTTNFQFAWMDIGMKSTFILFPIIFAVFPFSVNWTLAKKAFLFGALISIIINFFISTIDYLDNEKIWMFRESYLSHFMHRGYWATYLFVALLITVFGLSNNKKQRLINYSFGIILTFTILLTGSKITILLLPLLAIGLLIRFVIRERNAVKSLSIVIVSVLLLFLFFKFSPAIGKRFYNLSAILYKEKSIDITSTESNTSRILMWETALELIKEHPISGVGTGDIKDELQKRNFNKGYTGVAEANLNAHSQYLNTQLALGFLGTIALLGMLIVPFFKKSQFHIEIKLITSVFIIALLTESFLETQAGIIPIAFFLSLFAVIQREVIKKKGAPKLPTPPQQ